MDKHSRRQLQRIQHSLDELCLWVPRLASQISDASETEIKAIRLAQRMHSYAAQAEQLRQHLDDLEFDTGPEMLASLRAQLRETEALIEQWSTEAEVE